MKKFQDDFNKRHARKWTFMDDEVIGNYLNFKVLKQAKEEIEMNRKKIKDPRMSVESELALLHVRHDDKQIVEETTMLK